MWISHSWRFFYIHFSSVYTSRLLKDTHRHTKNEAHGLNMWKNSLISSLRYSSSVCKTKKINNQRHIIIWCPSATVSKTKIAHSLKKHLKYCFAWLIVKKKFFVIQPCLLDHTMSFRTGFTVYLYAESTESKEQKTSMCKTHLQHCQALSWIKLLYLGICQFLLAKLQLLQYLGIE